MAKMLFLAIVFLLAMLTIKLVRFGEQDFGFSHSSMQEFFLSKWLLRQWQEDGDFRMDKRVSDLTRQFVIDNVALLTEQELVRLNQGLAATLARPCRY